MRAEPESQTLDGLWHKIATEIEADRARAPRRLRIGLWAVASLVLIGALLILGVVAGLWRAM